MAVDPDPPSWHVGATCPTKDKYMQAFVGPGSHASEYVCARCGRQRTTDELAQCEEHKIAKLCTRLHFPFLPVETGFGQTNESVCYMCAYGVMNPTPMIYSGELYDAYGVRPLQNKDDGFSMPLQKVKHYWTYVSPVHFVFDVETSTIMPPLLLNRFGGEELIAESRKVRMKEKRQKR